MRSHGHSSVVEDEFHEALIPPASASRPGTAPQVDICAYLTKEENDLRRRQRERKALTKSSMRCEKLISTQITKPPANRRVNFRGRASYSEIGSPTYPDSSYTAPPLRRKAKFEKKNSERESSSSRGHLTDSAADTLTRLRKDRAAMQEGKLEKVIPPSSHLSQTPPLALSGNDRKIVSSSSRSSHKRAESTSSKLSSYIGSSADFLDLTRRDLTSSLRRGAEKAIAGTLGHFESLTHAQRQAYIDDTESDDESFFCIGESQTPRSLSELDKARRFSDEGTNPWTDGQQDECRLCKKLSPAGVRGLCMDCEYKFKQSKTKYFSNDDEDEIKPTPPLKIKKVSTVSRSTLIYPSSGQTTVPTAPPPRDARLPGTSFQNAGSRPMVVTLDHRDSQHASVLDQDRTLPGSSYGQRSRYEMWQTAEMHAEYERAEEIYGRWPDNLFGDDP